MLDTLFFYAFALLTLVGGLLTITRRSAVHSAISLIVSLLGVAGLYLLQRAEFLFVVQIVLYIGGIMLLFLFVIMLVNLDEAAKQRQFNGQWWLAIACLIGIALELAWFTFRGGAAAFPRPGALTGGEVSRSQRSASVISTEIFVFLCGAFSCLGRG